MILVSDSSAQGVIFNLGARPNVPEKIKPWLAIHPHHHDPETFDLFGRWPRSSSSTYLPLDAPVADAIATGCFSHPSFPEPLMAPYIDQQYGMGGYAMADHPFISEAMMATLGAHAYDYTRQKIASRSDAPRALLEKLAKDRSEMVRRAAQANLDRSPEALERTLAQPHAHKIGLPRWTPAELLRKLAVHAEPEMRIWVAMHANTPEDSIAKLRSDSDERVRKWADRRAS
jgi:hypothetical protein